MTSVKFSKLLAVLLAAILMLSLLSTVAAAADAEGTGDAEEVNSTAEEATDAEPEESAEAGESSQSASDEKKDEKKKEPNWDLIISLSLIGLTIIVLVVLYFAWPKFHEGTNKFFREYKSELGKIVWSSYEDVKKNTIVVIVIVFASALLIGVLDFLFNHGIVALADLFNK